MSAGPCDYKTTGRYAYIVMSEREFADHLQFMHEEAEGETGTSDKAAENVARRCAQEEGEPIVLLEIRSWSQVFTKIKPLRGKRPSIKPQ